MHEYVTIDDASAIHRHTIVKGRRRHPGVGQVLIAVPWTRNAAIDNPALTERAVLQTFDTAEILPSYRKTATRSPFSVTTVACLSGMTSREHTGTKPSVSACVFRLSMRRSFSPAAI
jgi:hypothetical protein